MRVHSGVIRCKITSMKRKMRHFCLRTYDLADLPPPRKRYSERQAHGEKNHEVLFISDVWCWGLCMRIDERMCRFGYSSARMRKVHAQIKPSKAKHKPKLHSNPSLFRLLPEEPGPSPPRQRHSLPPVRTPRSRSQSPSPQPSREQDIPGVLEAELQGHGDFMISYVQRS